MSPMVAIELARMLEQGVPHVKARAISLGSHSAVVAAFWRGGRAYPIILKDTTEYSLLLAFLQLKAEQAGRPLEPLSSTIKESRVMEGDKAGEPIYQY